MRENEDNHIVQCRQLFHQYIVDIRMYAKIETYNVWSKDVEMNYKYACPGAERSVHGDIDTTKNIVYPQALWN
jgi:hypothetical protein